MTIESKPAAQPPPGHSVALREAVALLRTAKCCSPEYPLSDCKTLRRITRWLKSYDEAAAQALATAPAEGVTATPPMVICGYDRKPHQQKLHAGGGSPCFNPQSVSGLLVAPPEIMQALSEMPSGGLGCGNIATQKSSQGATHRCCVEGCGALCRFDPKPCWEPVLRECEHDAVYLRRLDASQALALAAPQPLPFAQTCAVRVSDVDGRNDVACDQPLPCAAHPEPLPSVPPALPLVGSICGVSCTGKDIPREEHVCRLPHGHASVHWDLKSGAQWSNNALYLGLTEPLPSAKPQEEQGKPSGHNPEGVEARDGISLIAAERKRQIEKEGWTPEHDAEHEEEELALAASCYAMPALAREIENGVPYPWPWEDFWKPSPNDRVRELVKAGALIAAEIDRLARPAEGPPAPTAPHKGEK